jgi:hypothetical protein
MANGYVYILSNPSMPGLLKIGRSIYGGIARGKTFYQTGVPERFVLEFEIYTPEHEAVEAGAHERLKKYRANPGREFFACDVTDATEAVLSAHLSDCIGNGSAIVDEILHSATVDLLYLAHLHNLHWVDVMDAVSYISEFAIRKAVDEAITKRDQRRKELFGNG